MSDSTEAVDADFVLWIWLKWTGQGVEVLESRLRAPWFGLATCYLSGVTMDGTWFLDIVIIMAQQVEKSKELRDYEVALCVIDISPANNQEFRDV